MLPLVPRRITERDPRPGAVFDTNLARANAASYLAGARLLAVTAMRDGFYDDRRIRALVASGDVVVYADPDGAFRPASAIGRDAAVELFCIGYAKVEGAAGDPRRILDEMSPLMALAMGGPVRRTDVDFESAGRAWGFSELACTGDVTATDVTRPAQRLFELAVAGEASSGTPSSTGLLRTLLDGPRRRPSSRKAA